MLEGLQDFQTLVTYFTLHKLKPCLVAVGDCTHVHYVVNCTKSAHTTCCCYCCLHPCKVSYSLLQGLGNSYTGELHQPNIRCCSRGSAAVSFGISKEQKLHRPTELRSFEEDSHSESTDCSILGIETNLRSRT